MKTTREQFAAGRVGAVEKLAGKSVMIFGAGYIGSRLAAQACAAGARVVALTRNAERAAELAGLRVGEGVRVIRADLASSEWHDEVASALAAAGGGGGEDVVVNCVSGGGMAGGVHGYRRSYLEGMRSIVAWAHATGQRGRLVYTSSTSVYPQGDGVRVTESMPTATGADAADGAGAGTDVAGEVLLETEREALQGWPGGGVCVLRLAGIYGPARHHLLGQLRAAVATGAELPGGADDHLNLIYRDDVCDAVWAAALATAGGGGGGGCAGEQPVFNIADDAPPTRAELCGWLAERLGLPVPRFSGQPAAGRRRRTPDRLIVNERAKRVLGWAPRHPTFREGYEAIFERPASNVEHPTSNGGQ
ncbi:NAD-dependent epimerase/dehydratase family protein [Geminisphaera colitermitum]|uniref:NAD-dependent epimerase/dehydratase family protein n=1 Tax=Geminisphaera colitermitum TaxID=1148786 RepID=UPI0006938CBB|nr:NAD-dependent epimerase/dehydratase family protein [Geminisphaera colitermitum]